MNEPTQQLTETPGSDKTANPAEQQILIRYGRIPIVARCRIEGSQKHVPQRNSKLVVRTARGLEMADFLQTIKPHEHKPDVAATLERLATPEDCSVATELTTKSAEAFDGWAQRIENWSVDVELIDLEQTLDGEKLILYVLNDRGPETTKLAIQAAAAGFGTIEVQSVDANGVVVAPPTGQCGSGGCGCH